MAFAAPILPGKTEQWKQFAADLRDRWRDDYMNSRRQLGVHERAFLQTSPHGEMVIVTLEGQNPAAAMQGFAAGGDPFTKWFVQQVKDIHGFDLAEMASGPMPTLWIDSEQARTMGS